MDGESEQFGVGLGRGFEGTTMTAATLCELEYWLSELWPLLPVYVDIVQTAYHAAECAAIDAVLMGAM